MTAMTETSAAEVRTEALYAVFSRVALGLDVRASDTSWTMPLGHVKLEGGILTVTATDRYVIARETLDLSADLYVDAEPFELTANLGDLIVFTKALKAMGRELANIRHQVGTLAGEGSVIVETYGGARVVLQSTHGEFPRVEHMLTPPGNPDWGSGFDPLGFTVTTLAKLLSVIKVKGSGIALTPAKPLTGGMGVLVHVTSTEFPNWRAVIMSRRNGS